MFFYFIMAGLISGLVCTRLSIRECRGKEKVLSLFLGFAFLPALGNYFISLLASFVVAHVLGSLAYLRWENAHKDTRHH